MKSKNMASKVDSLLRSLDKRKLEEFIRAECENNVQVCNRFLALGADRRLVSNPGRYSSLIEGLIEDYSRHGYISYRDSFEFNASVNQILEEADEAMNYQQWNVAVAILTGVADMAEKILNSGDDSAGELSGIVDYCFEKWSLLIEKELPDEMKSDLFKLALTRFKEKNLVGWDWWWSWIQFAVSLANTPEQQGEVLSALDEIKKPHEDDWSQKYAYNQAQLYKLKMMARCGTSEEQRKFMYDHIENEEFRRKLLQMAWEEDNLDEVLRIAVQGIEQNAELEGLVCEWKEWEMKVYLQREDTTQIIRLARDFFLRNRVRFGEWEGMDFSMEAMYSLMKSKIDPIIWEDWVESLITDADGNQILLLYMYTQEKMWSRYMEYLRKYPLQHLLEEAPKQVFECYKDEFIKLYVGCVENHFRRASDRSSYQHGVSMLKTLIGYGGRREAYEIIEQQKARRPRRPALLDELSKVK